LTRLDDDDYAVREATGRDILKIGFLAEPELRRAAQEAKSAEVRIRARLLRRELFSRPRATLTGHTDPVLCLALSPDGKHLASGSRDGTARVWDVTTGKEVARFVRGPRGVGWSAPPGADAPGSPSQRLPGGADRLARDKRPVTLYTDRNTEGAAQGAAGRPPG
jgi:WD40 repeat protein